ncbi:STAS domain-containing protein [Roseomonas sp. E05]|uniref:STAS domain-containing protein n=1 Tax=Roseomonas sp. E05 TaxID=3046310 RepID=UPI0024BB8001|nr:STAS domain-containing protein [Roseomonas sp. E05]MDJ0389326.1 STAS domain-containing protein [Roseomonas sp. E05]
MPDTQTAARLIAQEEAAIVSEWLRLQEVDGGLGSGRVSSAELRVQCERFLSLLRRGLAEGAEAVQDPAFTELRDVLRELSRSRAIQGFTPTETATFIFALKEAMFRTLQQDADAAWALTRLLDGFGLYTFEAYQRAREEVIARQQREISELSTPVVKLWDGVLALPLIGTLDSERTQVVMENLLQNIVDLNAEIAIIDITGVPTVDTLVAQHLLKTIAAARLMGADCIISGIRPQIAQTMVHLGVDLNVVTKASLADAFALALRRVGQSVGRAAPVARPGA